MIRLLLAALAASTFALSGVAAANTIEVEPAGRIGLASLGKVTFAGGSFNFRCNLTLSGTIEASVLNNEGAPLGGITASTFEACEGGTWRGLFEESPAWELVLREEVRLEGAPASVIADIRSVQAGFVVAGVTCLYRGTLPVLIEASGSPLRTGLVSVQTNSLSQSSGSIFCPRSISASGTFALSPEQTLTLS